MANKIIQLLIEKLGPEKVLTGEALLERYVHIWKMDEPLNAVAVVIPKSTEDVSNIMKICHNHDQKVVVHGGLTNLVGSTETEEDELVISMEKMNAIVELDSKSRTITVQAGVILENIQQAVKEKALFFPLNFGAKGSAQIGGIISTNAGGLRVFRFGMTRNLVLGLEAVMADGTIISSMKKIIKDNSAYDLKQLFIGSEGTLGIVTKAVLKLTEAPISRNSALAAFNDYDKIIAFLKFMDRGLAGTLSGFELIWGDTYKSLTTPPALVKNPLPYGYQYYVLLESLGSDQDNDQIKMQALLEQALEEEILIDVVPALSQSDLDWFWKIREDVHVLVSRSEYDQHFDVSLPIPEIGKYVSQTVEKLKQLPDVNQAFTFGHVADGNIHFVVDKKNDEPVLTKAINAIIYEPLQSLGGSVSAEHGIGLHKKEYLQLSRTTEEINLMHTLKKAMDPKNILNRGKVL